MQTLLFLLLAVVPMAIASPLAKNANGLDSLIAARADFNLLPDASLDADPVFPLDFSTNPGQILSDGSNITSDQETIPVDSNINSGQLLHKPHSQDGITLASLNTPTDILAFAESNQPFGSTFPGEILVAGISSQFSCNDHSAVCCSISSNGRVQGCGTRGCPFPSFESFPKRQKLTQSRVAVPSSCPGAQTFSSCCSFWKNKDVR